MNDSNVLSEFNMSMVITVCYYLLEINGLDRTINEMKSQLAKETFELDQMNNQIASLRSQYEMKKMSLTLMNSRLNEKTKLLLEAKKGYNSV